MENTPEPSYTPNVKVAALVIAVAIASALVGFFIGAPKPITLDVNGKPTLLVIYFYVIVGIIISVVLPILRKAVPTEKKFAGFPAWFEEIKPYLMIGLFSALAAVIIVASLGETLGDWKAAVLAGFAWDSLLQKAGHG